MGAGECPERVELGICNAAPVKDPSTTSNQQGVNVRRPAGLELGLKVSRLDNRLLSYEGYLPGRP